MDGQVKMLKDQLNGMSEEDAEAKYADMMEKCLKMGEGKSESELEALSKEAEACPAAKEVKKLEEELYDKMMSEMDMDMDMDME